MYSKLVLNKLKVIKGPTSIYTPWGPNLQKPPWNILSPCVAHNWTKNELN
jgi:hypothetical protein